MNAIWRSVGAALAALAVAGAAAAEPKIKDLVDGESGKVQAKEQTVKEKPPKPVPPPGPPDDFDRGVPRSSVEGFLAAAAAGDWERGAEYLDLRNLARGRAPREGATLARQLSTVLDRALWIHPETLSTDPKGHADDDLPSYRDYIGRIETPETQVDILLQRVPRGDGVYVWKFSSVTVAKIPGLYAHHGFGRLGERLSEFFPPGRFLEIPLWEWGGVLLVVFSAFLAAWAVTAVLAWTLRRTRIHGIESLAGALRGPVRLLLFCIIGRSAASLLGPTVALRAVLEAQTLLLVSLVWVAMRVGDVMIDRAAQGLRRQGQAAALMLGRPARNLVRGLVVLVALVVWLHNLGLEVTTLLAGLGIGGLALALAAQRSIEDLIGAFTIYSTQPVRVGDFCRFGQNLGTVEEIGLRSTRVRTLDDTVVSVPNSEFAKIHLDNFGRRRKIRYHPRIRLCYGTTPEQIRYVLVEVRKLFYAHPRVQPDPARIRFVELGAWSLDLDVFAYVDTRDYGEYLEIAEDLNLRIMQIVADAGSSFAIPAQRTVVESGASLDGERARAAEGRVGEWRDRRELYLPGFPREVVEKLRGTIPYPPEGSPRADDVAAT